MTERLAASEGLDVGGDVSLLGAGAPVTVTVAGILAGDGPVPGSSGRTIVMPIATAAGLAPAEDGATTTDGGSRACRASTSCSRPGRIRPPWRSPSSGR